MRERRNGYGRSVKWRCRLSDRINGSWYCSISTILLFVLYIYSLWNLEHYFSSYYIPDNPSELSKAAPVVITITAGIKEIIEHTKPAIAIPFPALFPLIDTAAKIMLKIPQGIDI